MVNNVEPDHLECYGNMEALENAFVEFASRAQVAIASADDPGARKVAGRVGKTARTFGLAADADIRITDVVQRADRTEARIRWPDGRTVSTSGSRCQDSTTCVTRLQRWAWQMPWGHHWSEPQRRWVNSPV